MYPEYYKCKTIAGGPKDLMRLKSMFHTNVRMNHTLNSNIFKL